MHDVTDWSIFLGKDMTNVLKPIYMCDLNFAQILFSIYTRILQVMYLNRSKLKSKVKHVLSLTL
jgi:hypothetical protein